MKVRDVLNQKDRTVYSVSFDSTVYDALKLMADKNLGSLLVISENALIGIFTERDYARKVILKGKFSKETLIADVMHPNPLTVTEDTDVEACMNLMTNKFVRHLPVTRNGAVIGIVSIGDVVKSIITEQQYIINNLDHYISGQQGFA